MVVGDEYEAILIKLEELLFDLDRLDLSNIAVHVDLALRRLEELIANSKTP